MKKPVKVDCSLGTNKPLSEKMKEEITCPHCKSTFDVSGYFEALKRKFDLILEKAIEDYAHSEAGGEVRNKSSNFLLSPF